MFYLLGVASILVVLQTEQTEAVCGVPIVWRNNNISCPARAICADVFNIMRDWLNGTQCHERRTLHNCLCNGDTVCPTSNPAHRLYSSIRHELYTCQPVCQIPWCGNIRMPPSSYRSPRPSSRNRYSGRGRYRGRGSRTRTNANPTPIAFKTIQNASEFGGKTYNQMSCRCPRHQYPSTVGRRDRSVRSNGWEYNYTLRRFASVYVCDTRPAERERENPCPPNLIESLEF